MRRGIIIVAALLIMGCTSQEIAETVSQNRAEATVTDSQLLTKSQACSKFFEILGRYSWYENPSEWDPTTKALVATEARDVIRITDDPDVAGQIGVVLAALTEDPESAGLFEAVQKLDNTCPYSLNIDAR